MQLVMAEDATSEQVEEVTVTLRRIGLEPALVHGGRATRISLPGSPGGVGTLRLELLAGVARIIEGSQPFTKASWEFCDQPTVVELPNATRIGGRELVVAAGACLLEPDDRLVEAAHAAREAGATLLHGGAFGPRGVTHSDTRCAERALKVLARARAETGMAIVAEALDGEAACVLAECVDVLQVGPDNMQNFPLLRRVARLGRPVSLVRGPVATISELLQAAEYVLAEGNADAILCEAGVLHPASEGRRVLDLAAVPVIKSLSHLPVLVWPGLGPPRHGRDVVRRDRRRSGRTDRRAPFRVRPPAPEDGTGPLDPAEFTDAMRQVRQLADALGRSLAPPPAMERARA
jgi:3-deoxy-7-phosphoheptulonate synthase